MPQSATGFDALGVGQQLLAEFRQAIAWRVKLHQRLPDCALQFSQAPLHRQLTKPQRFPNGNRAAVPGDGQKLLQIVPIIARLCTSAAGYRNPAAYDGGARRLGF